MPNYPKTNYYQQLFLPLQLVYQKGQTIYYNPQTKHLLKVSYDFNLLKCIKDNQKLYADEYGRVLIQDENYITYCINLPFTDSVWTVIRPKGSDKIKFVKNNKTGFYLVVRC